MPSLRSAKVLADSHGAPATQLALASFIDDGMFARHIRRLLRVYRERRELLIGALHRHLRDDVVLLPSSAGLHTSVYFGDRGLDTDALVGRAWRRASPSIRSIVIPSSSPGRPRHRVRHDPGREDRAGHPQAGGGDDPLNTFMGRLSRWRP